MNLQINHQYAIKNHGAIQQKFSSQAEAEYHLSNLRQSSPGLYENASVVVVTNEDNRELLLG